MTEEEIRKIVRDELANECFREGGVYDHCRIVALGMVKPIIDVNLRTIRDELREDFGPGVSSHHPVRTRANGAIKNLR